MNESGFRAKVFVTHLYMHDHTVFSLRKCDSISKTPGAVVFNAHIPFARFDIDTYASYRLSSIYAASNACSLTNTPPCSFIKHLRSGVTVGAHHS
jgi:hypothetical protein